MKELTSIEAEKLLQEQHQFFDTQKTKSIEFRKRQLLRLKLAIKMKETEILAALHADLGKHEAESYATEVGFIYNSINEAVKKLSSWAKPKKAKTDYYLMPTKSYTMYEPYGSVLIIGPYNYPFHLVMEPLIGALAAGNCVVVKPSEVTPHTSRLVTELITKLFPRYYIHCVEGAVETTTSLINAPFDYIFFTGSTRVGKVVMEAASKNLVPVTLELGGKSPVIVDETANIKEAAKRIIWGKTLNVGQTCVAPDYVYVKASIKDRLIEEMKRCIVHYFGEDASVSRSFGRIINERHFDRIHEMLVKDEKYIVYGGNSNRESCYIEPTLLDIPSWSAASMGEEIFGPLLPILTYENLDDVIKEIRKHPKPLALYLFTGNHLTEKKVLHEISSGGVSVNDTMSHIVNTNLPFGGVGHSGMGNYHGRQSFYTFSHAKGVLKKTKDYNITVAYPKYTNLKYKLIRMIMR